MRAPPHAALLAAALGLVARTASAIAQTITGPAASEASPITPSTAQARAVVHYERSRAYYAAGRYRAAITELETAARLDPSGYNLFFDLGLVYERIGRIDEAMGAYRRYLAHTQDPLERERAERIIARLVGARVELAEIAQRRGHADALFWTVSVGSAVSLVAGGTLLASALRADGVVDELQRGGAPEARVRESMSSANTQHIAADVALIGGGALAVTAVLLYLLREAPPPNTPLCVSANGAGLRLRF
jgi:Flp pilus assembly protein TadD